MPVMTKAESLQNIKKKGVLIPNSYFFTVKEWANSRKKILEKISKLFYNYNLIVVRSSALIEDSYKESFAGHFESVLEVNVKDLNEVEEAIIKVINSYDENLENQVLIQEMVERVNCSGVIMTKVLDDGSPYYVINFDDISGKTDSVTSGNSINKTVYIYNGFQYKDFDNNILLAVIKKVRKIEKIYNGIPLDIEFAAVEKNLVYILQIRPITTIEKWDIKSNKLVDKRLPLLDKFIQNHLNRKKGLFGTNTLLGIMPDWNPAEMIGLVPNPLSTSLYRALITKKVWRISREMMGYKRLPDFELMISLYGRPYIDVRNSFNSFLPQNLSPGVSEKLVNSGLQKLEKEPQLHDKVEFEVFFTCFEFDFKNKFKDRFPGILSNKELTEYRESLFDITNKAIKGHYVGSLLSTKKQIDKLIDLQNDFSDEFDSEYQVSFEILKLVNECIEYGTVPFSIAARHGFIAEVLMKSLISLGAISNKRIIDFKRSIKTISFDLSNDYYKVCNGQLSQSVFLKKYGHLRPSSYDIMSPAYDKRLNLFKGSAKPPNKVKGFNLTMKEAVEINKILVDEGFLSFNANELFLYFKTSIKYREYHKFVFTKHLSRIIELVAIWGGKVGLSREDVSFLSIEDVLSVLYTPLTSSTKMFFDYKIKKSRNEQFFSKSLKLSYLIRSSRDIYIAPMQRSVANFIGSEKIEGEIVFLNPKDYKDVDIDSKIVCIEGADPGYDWIFSRNILGLITKFGGVNSHMAIRCSEHGLPAAIGCGEQPFQKIIKSKRILLDCKVQKLKPLDI